MPRQTAASGASLSEQIPPGEKGHYVYILECSDHTLYTGWTTDLTERLKAHNGESRGGAKCTRARRPVRLVYFESCDTKSKAMSREALIKKMTRAEKLALICKK